MKSNLELIIEIRLFLKLLAYVDPSVDVEAVTADLDSAAHNRELLLDIWHEMQFNHLHGMNVVPC